MILDLVKPNDPILKQKCWHFNFDKPPVDPHKLAVDLRDTMVYNRGIGLAASQVGLPYRVFVVGDPGDPNNIKVFFNPKIVDQSEDKVLIEEGCLSYPGLFIKVKRAVNCRVRYADPRGEIDTKAYDGIPARSVLHEYDHLDGILFHSRANSFHREQGKNQKKKLDKIRLANKKKISIK